MCFETRKLIILACITPADHEQVTLHREFEATFFFHLHSSILGVEKYLDFSRQESIKQYQEVVRPKAYLNKWLKMEDREENYARSQLLVFLGVTEGEIEEGNDRFGPLDGLTAANIFAGPFGITFTDHPSKHLTFSGSRDKPILNLLSLQKIKTLYVPQRTGIAT